MSNFNNSILEFALAMQNELDKNSYKDGWGACKLVWLIKRAKQEIDELERAIDKNESTENVISECADVANFIMMVADNYESELLILKEAR